MASIPTAKLLRQLKNVPGVVCVGLYNHGLLVDSIVPEGIGPEFIEGAAVSLQDMVGGLEMAGSSVRRLTLMTREFCITVLPAGSHVLLVLADKTVNNSLLGLAFKMVTNKLARKSRSKSAEADSEEGPGEEYREALERLLAVFKDSVGAVGGVLFKRCDRKARKSAGTDREKLEMLKALLSEQVDSSKRKAFVAKAAQL